MVKHADKKNTLYIVNDYFFRSSSDGRFLWLKFVIEHTDDEVSL